MQSMDLGAKRWTISTAKKNYWRVAGWYDLDDLIQDGHMCYAKVYDRYKEVATSKAHLMALYKTTFTNHITNLAKQRTHQLDVPECVALDFIPKQKDHDGIASLIDNFPDLSGLDFVAIGKNAPDVIQKFVAMMQSPELLKRWARPYRRYLGGRRETTSERLCRLLGLPKGTDVRTEIIRYFS